MITHKYRLYENERNKDLLAAKNILRRGIDELGDKINPQPSRVTVFVRA